MSSAGDGRSDEAPAPAPIWSTIVDEVMALAAGRDPSASMLTKTLEHSARYAVVDQTAQEIVLDSRSLVLGALSATRSASERAEADGAPWLSKWVAEAFGGDPAKIDLAKFDAVEAVGDARSRGLKIVASRTVQALFRDAATFSGAVKHNDLFEFKHLLASTVPNNLFPRHVANLFGQPALRANLDIAKTMFVGHLLYSVPRSERRMWREALNIGPPAPTPEDVELRPLPRDEVAGFSADYVRRGDPNLLGSSGDVTALARLVCLADAAPLAIAVFGGWGSGKSTFMDRLDGEVERIAAGAAPLDGPPTDGTARFINRVVQIRFNAWQFVDANLWASLTAEFFDQLRAGGWEPADKLRHGALVDKVNRHVHSLAADAEESRKAAIDGDKTLLAAQKERDEAARDARNAGGAALGQAVLDQLGDLYEKQKGNLTALGLATSGADAGKAIDTVLDVAKGANSSVRSLWAVVRTLAKSPARLLLAGAGLAGGAWLGVHLFERIRAGLALDDLGALFGLIGSLGVMAAAAAPAVRLVASVSKWGAGLAAVVDQADKTATQALLKKEVGLREARAEALARQAAAERSAQALARYIDPSGAPNPPRLLRYVLEDDPNTKALQSEIGLIGRTRRLFQAVDDIVARETPEERRKNGTPDRIVLYIDDLDRCDEKQVYAVLQAIHLLLAFRLFVVVVGVDVAWVEKALASSLGVAEEKDRRKEAVRYLEKIFQVAFWLSPLDSGDGDGGSYGRYVRALTAGAAVRAEGRVADDAEPAGDGPGGDAPAVAGTPAAEPAAENEAGAPHTEDVAEDEAVTAEAALATIQLTTDEVDFLASPEIAALAGGTPRSVKRMINLYRLARVRLAEDGGAIMGDEGRPPDYPLIALAVAIETGQPVEVADDVFTGLRGWPAIGPVGEFPEAPPSGDMTDPLVRAIAGKSVFKGAFKRVHDLRGGNFTVGDLLRVLIIVRRYSFNGHRTTAPNPPPAPPAAAQ